MSGIFIGFMLGVTTCSSVIKSQEQEKVYKDTTAKQGNCIIKERVFKPEFKLECEEEKE